MKKKIKAIALAAVMSLGMTFGMAGCGDDDNGGGGGSLSASGESAYILISVVDNFNGGHTKKGQGVKEALEKCDEVEDEDKPFVTGSMVYFNDGEFKLFDGTAMMQLRRTVSGNYSMGSGDEVEFENERIDLESLKSGEKSYYDVTTDTSENMNKYALKGVQEDLETSNSVNCLCRCANLPSFQDVQNANSFLAPESIYNGKGEFSELYNALRGNYPDGIKLYSKGNYLACKQKGYTFKGEPGSDDFVFNLEQTNTGWKVTYFMHPDGTWDRKFEDHETEITGGTWEQRDDNLIVVTHPKSIANVDAYFYLDYDENEVYLPVYMKCNDFLDIAKSAE